MRAQRYFLTLWLCGVLSVSLQAQAPSIENADVVIQPLNGGLKPAVEALVRQASEPVWIGYRAPMIAGNSSMCCFHGGDHDGACCKGCNLEGSPGGGQGSSRTGPVQLEPSREVLVLLRAEAGALGKVRSFSSDCPLDAGGRRLYWLSGVDARQSVDYLAELVRGSDWSGQQKRVASGAMAALAHHAGAPADAALAGFLAPQGARELRKQTAFWLCTARGASGLEAVRKAVRNDKDAGFRKEAMFAISVSRESAAVEELIHFARNDSSGPVRKQALFWLAQKAGRQATAALTEAIERDPDTQVKKHAVFALSQLPKHEGVPLLIQVARNNANPAVRKQAMFWLGQSDDPRALQFFEEVLSR